MEIISGGRVSGKSSQLAEWLKNGHEIDRYPFWSRIVLCPTIGHADKFRNNFLRDQPSVTALSKTWYQWVYAFSEWKDGRFPQRHELEVAVDNGEWLIYNALGIMPDYFVLDDGSVIEQ